MGRCCERGRPKDTVRNSQRRPAPAVLLIPDLNVGTVVHEKLYNRVQPSVRRAVHGCLTVVADSIHVSAELECQRNGVQHFALAPSVGYGVPTHDYPFVGEAVVGRNLNELRLAIDSGLRLDAISPRLSISGRNSYADQFAEPVVVAPLLAGRA